MNSVLKEIFKMLIAGLLAVLILNIFCLFYDFTPQVLQDWQENCPTGLSHRHGQFYSKLSEGIGIGFTDEIGYINPKELSSYDIVLMGGSHIQALQVMQTQSVTQQLSNLFKGADDSRNVYNIGMSAWTLKDTAVYLSQVCENLHPTQYVCVELQSLNIDNEIIRNALEGKKMSNGGYSILKDVLYYIPFLRKISAVITMNVGTENKPTNAKNILYNHGINVLLQNMNETVEKAGAKLVLFYHPTMKLQKDGSIQLGDDYEKIDEWRAMCADNAVIFVDVTPYFMDGYVQKHMLPYGFVNTGVGEGHMNEYGHSLMAEAIFESIKQFEEN